MKLVVGDMVSGKVVKSLPDLSSYLVNITGTELFATLQKYDALRDYRVGDTLLGAIKDIRGARIWLSQRIPQFTKKILELELRDIILRHQWLIKRAVVRPPIGKVLVDAQQDFQELNKIFLKAKAEQNLLSFYYGAVRLYLIPRKEDINSQVVEALRPAPVDKIVSIQSMAGQTVVYVPAGMAGLFVGKGGCNLLTAARLIGRQIHIREA